MPLRYEIDPTGPDGTVLAIDDDAGLRRVVWDPERAKTLNPPAPLDGSDTSTLQGSGGPPPAPKGQPGQIAPVAPPPAEMQAPPIPPPPVEMPGSQPQPMAPPPPRASMAFPEAPPAPAGTVITKAELTPGTPAAPYDKAAEERRHNDLLDRNVELDSRRQAEQAIRTEQGLELNKQRLEDEKAQRVEAEKASRYATELDQVVRKEVNPSRIMQGIGPSLMGLVGMAVAGFSKNPGLAMSRMNAALDRRIDQDVKLQTEQKDSMVNHLTKQLGSAQQAELHYKASVRGLAMDRLQSQLDSMGVGNKYADLIQAGRDDVETIDDAAKAASYGKPATAKYEFGQPKAVKGAGPGLVNGMSPGQAAYIASLPPGAEQYQETELARMAEGRGQKPDQVRADWAKWTEEGTKNASTRQAIGDVKAVIKPYEAEGDVPGKGLIVNNFPQWATSDEGRRVRQQLGLAEAYLLHDLSGAAVSPEELKRIHGVVEGIGTYDDLKSGLDTIERATKAKNLELDNSNRGFARIRDKTSAMAAEEAAKGSKAKAAQDEARGKGKKPEPAAKPAKSEDDEADPVKKIKKKGVSKYLQDSFSSGGSEPPGSAM